MFMNRRPAGPRLDGILKGSAAQTALGLPPETVAKIGQQIAAQVARPKPKQKG